MNVSEPWIRRPVATSLVMAALLVFGIGAYRLLPVSVIAAFAPVSVPAITLELQRRDPATGAITLQKEEVDPERVGVIAVDVWNFHWCKTATMRVDASCRG